ncbi:Ig-like domain-containing protein [Taibaiella koreensis]|uniref:Ig-like domain-containing protein n=1 Tax=Taibaiella koreensis TaxID=1268548 RepID=UPI0037439C75
MNGLSDNTVNGTGVNPGGLYAVLWDVTAGKVLDTVSVAANGTYTLAATPSKNYNVIITTQTVAIGATTQPASALPSGWRSRGENLGAGAGSDGNVNGVLTVAVGTTNVTDANFGINQVPVVSNDTLTNQTPGTPATVPNVLANDNDPGGGTLSPDSISLVPPAGATGFVVDAQGDTTGFAVPGQGTWTLNANGSVTFTPEPGFTGDPTPIGYTVTDNAGLPGNTGTIFIDFTPPPAPIAVNDTATTTINTPLNGTVAGNDTCGIGGGACSYSPLASDPPANGTLSLNPDGTYTYTPNPGFMGADTFSYTICKNGPPVLCDTAMVFLTITGPPVAVNDTASTPMNTPLNGTVTANDVCGPDGPCSYSPLASDPPTNGTVTVNPDGTYTYTPNPGFSGTDTFSYVVCNSATPVACDTAMVFLTVTGPPVAVNDTVSTPMNTPLNGIVTDNDTCRIGPCNYSPLASDPPTNGTVTINPDGTYTYTPNPGFSGTDTFSYVVCNSATPVACDTAMVFLTVTGPPVAVNDTVSIPMNTPLNGTVTTNDTCRMGPCSYSPLASDPPTNGTVTVNPDGTYTYTPNPGFSGTDTFSYVVCNSATPVACDTAMVFLTVTGPPVAVNDTVSTPMNTPLNGTVTANDTCRMGPCNYSPLASDPPTNGTVTVNPDGTYTYTPNPGFSGTDTFSYVVCNSATPVACDTAMVFLTVTGPPVAVNDTVSTPMNTPLNGTVTTNDTCRMGPCSYSPLASDPPTNGTLSLNPDGTYTYTPNPGFSGTDTFSYVVCNSASPVALCDTAQVLLTITSPAAVNDTATTPMNTPVNGTVTTNDVCGPDGPCSYSPLASEPPTNGTLNLNPDGTYTYTPNPGFSGTDTFSYVVCNSAVPTPVCDTAQVFLTITGAPVAVDDTVTTPINTPLNGTVTANDTCRTGPCSYSPLASDPPTSGTLSLNPDGTYTYTPNPSFSGTDTFSYVVCNSAVPDALCDTAQVIVRVGNIVPVDLLSFTAKAEADCDVQLSWRTGVELNFDYFEIGWSSNGASFTGAGRVAARGSGNSYSYSFGHGVKGMNYFRLKEVDRDGSYHYSRIVSANLGCAPQRHIKVYPTVHKGLVTVEGLQAGESVMVYDMKGIAVLQTKAAGPVAELNLSHTTAGSYTVIVILQTGERMHYKIVKQ